MNTAHILVIEDSETTLLKLKVVLSYFGYKVTTHSDSQTALDWLTETLSVPDLILSDVLMPGMSGIEFTQKVRGMQAFAHIPIVLLSADTDDDVVLAGRTAGADQYLNKGLSAGELTEQIKAILERRRQPNPADQIPHRTITVFSLRGGVGTTSLAVNLSIGLKQLWGGSTALWDLALSTGHCSVMLGLKPEPPQMAWPESLSSGRPLTDLLVSHESGVQVLLAPAGAALLEPVSPVTADEVWKAMHARYQFLVVDGGSTFTEPLRRVLQTSDQILLPVSPDPVSMKSVRDTFESIEKLGIGLEKVVVVLNHTTSNGVVKKGQVSASLGRQILAEIPYDDQNFHRAITSLSPVLISAPASDGSLALQLLAYKLSKEDMEAHKGDEPSPLLHKIRQLEWELEVGLVKW
jgi:pilus assembly protein CpaE